MLENDTFGSSHDRRRHSRLTVPSLWMPYKAYATTCGMNGSTIWRQAPTSARGYTTAVLSLICLVVLEYTATCIGAWP